jgi:hypothetical protein
MKIRGKTWRFWYVSNGFPIPRKTKSRSTVTAAISNATIWCIGGNENHIGSIYAGAIFTLAEMPGGALFMSTFDASRYYPVVKDLNLRFRRPSFGDVSIEISLSKEEIRRINGEVAEKGNYDWRGGVAPN